MFQVSKVLFSAVLCAAITVSANAATSVITSVSTSPVLPSPAVGDLELLSITDGSGTLSSLSFATVSSSSGGYLYGSGGTDPGSANAALSGNRIDTGKLGVGASTLFEITPTSASDKLFIIFNSTNSTSFYQGPGLVSALNGGGTSIGSVTVNPNDGPNDPTDPIMIGDEFATANLVGSNTLDGRLLLGVTIDVADFGVADVSQIAGFTIAGEVHTNATVNSFDIHTVGLAVPEPSSIALVLAGLVGVCRRRRRQ